ncbi:hypothetical protein GCM10009839_04290 [Catenulispora yoronensis]|uniref:Uncharacterized protein n=1 Tax=Catenulispora yoronensis TaxID=450799 RepID=A0ABN2TM06_9ACTN
MALRGDYRITMARPEIAIRLPIGEDGDLSTWAEMTARAHQGYDAPEADVVRFAEAILAAAADSSKREVAMAYLLPDEVSPVEMARIEVVDVNPDQTVPAVTLDWLEQVYSVPGAELVAPVDVWRGELPAGPAIRVVRQVLTDVDEFGDGLLVHSVVYAVRPPGTDFAVVLSVTWSAVLLAEELLEMADALAQTVQVLPAH